jgi:hypothetical protein
LSQKAASPRRRHWLSLLGAAFAVLYLAAFVAGYVVYLQNVGRQWFPDLPLLLIAIPFTWTMNVLTNGVFSMTGDETGKVLVAAFFCCALAYVAGAIVESLLRALWRALLPPVKSGEGGSEAAG